MYNTLRITLEIELRTNKLYILTFLKIITSCQWQEDKIYTFKYMWGLVKHLEFCTF